MPRYTVPMAMWVEAPTAEAAHDLAAEAAAAMLPALLRREGDARIVNFFVGERRQVHE